MLNTCIYDYDVIFIQEPPIRELRKAPSSSNQEGEAVIGTPIHPEWLYVARPINSTDRIPRVMAYINKRLKHMRPSLWLDLINHPDIQVLSLFNEEREYCLLNIYNADNNSALMHLSDCTDDLLNSIVYMGSDFNIHAHLWDPTFRGPEQPECWDLLLETAEELGLELSLPENPGSTHIPRDRSKQHLGSM